MTDGVQEALKFLTEADKTMHQNYLKEVQRIKDIYRACVKDLIAEHAIRNKIIRQKICQKFNLTNGQFDDIIYAEDPVVKNINSVNQDERFSPEEERKMREFEFLWN